MRNSETVEPISVHRPSLRLTKKGLSQVQAPVDLCVQPNNPSSSSMVDHLGSCWMTIAWSDSHPHHKKSWLKEFGYPVTKYKGTGWSVGGDCLCRPNVVNTDHNVFCSQMRWNGCSVFWGGNGFSLYIINWIAGKWVCGHQGNLMEAMLVVDNVLRDPELI